MKILLAHNDYGKYSGEEAVVDRMHALYEGMGHEVAELRRTTAGLADSLSGRLRVAMAGVYSRSGRRAMREAIGRERPDVVNVHNLFPFIGSAALRECRAAGVPVVMTVHNFRLICPTGLFMRDGEPCELCLERGNEWGCVRHNCEESAAKSVSYALRNYTARLRGDFRDCVDRFACITDFQRRKLIEAGFPAEKIVVIPNYVEAGEEPGEMTDGDYVAYCGRVSYEKGGDLFVELARQLPDIRFRMAGEVRDSHLLGGNVPENLELAGYVSGQKLEDFYRGARFVVMPSRCYEGFPMAILEAARYARPVIGPDHGGFSEIIGHGEDASGLLFKPGDFSSLREMVECLWNDSSLCWQLGQHARGKLVERYSREAVTQKWEKLLESLR